MGYSKKASKPQSSSNADWDGFNEHLLEQIGEASEARIGILSGIIELGIQERPDFVEKYKGTKAQDAKLKNDNTYLSEDETEIITEMSPAEQVAFYADFPEIQINYGKFFSADGEDDWKPYRHLLTNTYWDQGSKQMLAKGAALSCRKDDKAPSGYAYDGKSTISKLALFTKAVEKAPVDQDFELGDLLGGVFTLNLQAVKDDKYVNIKGTGIGSKHAQLPTPEYDLEPFGISFDGDNEPEDIKQVRVQLWNTIKRAKNWETSGLKKDLEAYEAAKKEESGEKSADEEEEQPKSKKPAKKAPPKKAPAKKKEPEPDVDEDDDEDCPFDE